MKSAALVLLLGCSVTHAATVKSVTDVAGVRYYDVMTTNPNESYNGVQGRDPRIDRLYQFLNVHCRGDSGDNPDTQKYCEMRDVIGNY